MQSKLLFRCCTNILALSFGKVSITIPHCQDLLNRYHYAFVPSSFIPAMERKIIYVYFLKDPLPYLFEIMYIG